jgi:predicted Zn-dependent peptidase
LHPYGRTVDAEAIADLSLADLQAYHARHFQLGNAYIILSGDFETKEMITRLEDLFAGTVTTEAIPYAPSLNDDHSQLTGRQKIEMSGKPQSTLRAGFSIPNRLHPDFHLARFATLVLGGYFGSRLMRNLREEKGYTYGASASWGAYRHSGYFVMGADVSNEHAEPALAEMRKELERMCSEPVHLEELEVARNFWLGRLAARAETPFEAAEILRAYVANGLTLADDEMAFRAVQQATASDLLRVAQTHFKPQQLFEVIAGG